MSTKKLYENYHKGAKFQKTVINRKNFTYRNIVEVLDKLKRIYSVLDIGCGTGTLDFYLAKQGKSIDGIDISSNAISTAKINARNFNLDKNIKFYVGDIQKKLPVGKYDLVILSEVIEHVYDGKSMIKKINILLRKNGILFLSTPLVTAPLYRLGVTSAHDIDAGHVHIYGEKEIVNLLKKENFKIVKVKKSEGIFRNSLFVYPSFGLIVRVANRFGIISDLLTFIDDVSLKLFGASQVIIVAKK